MYVRHSDVAALLPGRGPLGRLGMGVYCSNAESVMASLGAAPVVRFL